LQALEELDIARAARAESQKSKFHRPLNLFYQMYFGIQVVVWASIWLENVG